MHREYHVDHSAALERPMERLVFGHAGLPIVVFPTACGRFYDFENGGMVSAIETKLHRGEVQLFCVDSVDRESWYAEDVPGRWRIARHLQFEHYILDELLPEIHRVNPNRNVAVAGCAFGAFHAVSHALRHPDKFCSVLSMGGTFDHVQDLLKGHYDDDCYYVLPTHFLPNLSDGWYLDRFRHNTYVLATGEHDPHRHDSEHLAGILRAKGVSVRFDVWHDHRGHEWEWWRKMLAQYL